MATFITVFLTVLTFRYFEVKLFQKKVIKICYQYDKKVVNFNPEYLVEMLVKDEFGKILKTDAGFYTWNPFYRFNNTWSAFYFLIFNEPRFKSWNLFFHPNILTLKSVYGSEKVKKVKTIIPKL
jgi:hypothetical protein